MNFVPYNGLQTFPAKLLLRLCAVRIPSQLAGNGGVCLARYDKPNKSVFRYETSRHSRRYSLPGAQFEQDAYPLFPGQGKVEDRLISGKWTACNAYSLAAPQTLQLLPSRGIDRIHLFLDMLDQMLRHLAYVAAKGYQALRERHTVQVGKPHPFKVDSHEQVTWKERPMGAAARIDGMDADFGIEHFDLARVQFPA